MPARKPEEVHRLFSEGVQRKRSKCNPISFMSRTLLSFPSPGKRSGGMPLSVSFERLPRYEARFVFNRSSLLESNDIAILFSSWTLAGTGPDGKAVSMAGQTTDVVRRQKDGTWLLAIDNPFGPG